MQRSGRFIWLALTLITLGVYAPMIQNDFINFDDPIYVTENPHVTTGLTKNNLLWSFTAMGYASNWHPLTWLSHMLDCQLFGLNPAGHHATNLLFHLANVLLLFALLWRMTGAKWPSAFVAAVFAWHPLHVESVAWVAERKDVLSALFWLLTMFAYVRYAEKPGYRRYLLTLGLYALGLMSKPMLVTLPCVLLLLDYWPLSRNLENRGREVDADKTHASKSLTWKQLFLEKIPFFILAAISSGITIFAQHKAGSVASLTRVPVIMRGETALVSAFRYIVRLFLPRHLSIYYPPMAGWPMTMVLGSAFFLLAVSVVAFRARRGNPYLVTGWLWFLVTLLPVIGLIQVGTQSMADRYMYVPMIGLLIMVAWDFDHLSKNWPGRTLIISLCASIVLGACLVLTWTRLHYWKNSETLFRQSLRVAPVNNFMAHACLGMYLSDHGHDDEAIEHFRASAAIAPTFYVAQIKMGDSLARLRKIDEAIEQYRRILKLDPNSTETLNTLAWILATCGDPRFRNGAEAVQLARRACDLTRFKIPVMIMTLAAAHAEAGQFSEAIQAAEQAQNVATTSRDYRVAETNRKLLELYRANRPYHLRSEQPVSDVFLDQNKSIIQ